MMKEIKHEPIVLQLEGSPHWVFEVEETYCSECGTMRPVWLTCGHFMCNVCGNLTGFWMKPCGAPNDFDGVKTWNKQATFLLPVPFKLKGREEVFY